jgi:hypothetical protein
MDDGVTRMKAKVTLIRETVSTYLDAGSAQITEQEMFSMSPEFYAKLRKAEKKEIHSWYHEALTANDILIVFSLPTSGSFTVGDELEIDLEQADAEQDVENQTTGNVVRIRIQKNNIHDLRIPMQHRGSRFPSPERRAGA